MEDSSTPKNIHCPWRTVQLQTTSIAHGGQFNFKEHPLPREDWHLRREPTAAFSCDTTGRLLTWVMNAGLAFLKAAQCGDNTDSGTQRQEERTGQRDHQKE
ncbi:hypothetical protein ACOMHN_011837 [Nucella lapillus]